MLIEARGLGRDPPNGSLEPTGPLAARSRLRWLKADRRARARTGAPTRRLSV